MHVYIIRNCFFLIFELFVNNGTIYDILFMEQGIPQDPVKLLSTVNTLLFEVTLH